MDLIGDIATGLLPTVGVSALFGLAIWAIVRADARERQDTERLEAEEDRRDAERLREDGTDESNPSERRESD